MPFSHHSHSGQFCNHAENKLEEMVQTAISKKMSVYCLTEHMPRGEQDLYPEEVLVDADGLCTRSLVCVDRDRQGPFLSYGHKTNIGISISTIR